MFRFGVRGGRVGAIGSRVITSVVLSYTCRCSNLVMYNARRSVLARSHAFGCSIYLRSSTLFFSFHIATELQCACTRPRVGKLCGHRVVTVYGPCGHSLEMLNQLSEGKWQMFLKMKKLGVSEGYIL